MSSYDYSTTIFDQGIVCFNTNNKRLCIVIDGRKGDEYDRCSTVLEQNSEYGFIVHTPPNRALIPTGKVVDLTMITNVLRQNVVVTEP